MQTKYVIDESTLKDIADSIRVMEETDDVVPVNEYAERIRKIEPTTEDFMRITDHLNYPELINESNYTKEEVAKCQALIDFYTEMEDITNG